MHRELNPNLFGPTSITKQTPETTAGASSREFMMPSQTSIGMPQVPSPIPAEIKQLEAQVTQLRIQLQQSDKRNEKLVAQINELIRTLNGRFERVSQTVSRLENGATQQIQELNNKYGMLASKMNERRGSDAKIQEMIDRHNLIVRNFENRLTHMQRLMTEQESQIHNAHAALEEARLEIARLKRT